jgi:hypothetical protein
MRYLRMDSRRKSGLVQMPSGACLCLGPLPARILKSTPMLFLNRRPIALLAGRNDPQRFIRQRALQRNCIVDRALKPCVPFLFSRNEHRHCLGVNWPHNVIRLCRKKCKQAVLTSQSIAAIFPRKQTAFALRQVQTNASPSGGCLSIHRMTWQAPSNATPP